MDNTSQPSTTPHTSETTRTLFQCRVCKKGYGRPDHLIRHVRSHTTDKPFICERCGKGFGRIEVLRRHVRIHGPNSHRGSSGPSGMRERVSLACKRCAASKLKCDDKKPCRRCVQRGQVCEWSAKDDTFATVQDHEEEVLPAHQLEQVENDQEPTKKEPQPVRPPEEGLLGISGAATSSEETMMANDGTSAISPESKSFSQGCVGLNAFPLTGLDLWDSYDSAGIDFGLTNEDLELIDSIDRPPLLARQAYDWNPQLRALHDLPTDTKPPNQVVKIELQDSPLSHWTPRAEDNAYMDQQYLSLPPHLNNPHAAGILHPRIIADPLSRESRDAAFALVVKICQWKDLNRIMQCFPSTELLDSLIHDFLIWQRSETDSWIHEPTLDLNREGPEMILTLAAAGAVLSNVEAIQRLGYAMQEVARLQVNNMFEVDNTLTRSLKQQQAYALILQIGLWSGDKRRVEIAESCFQPVVTMLRRASRFKHEPYHTVAPTAVDDGSTLDQKWRIWSEQESFKRLAHHIFIHDSQSSALRSTNPLISYAELDLSLPFSRKLWDAKTAAQWKAIYLQEVPETPPSIISLATLLQGISSLGRIARHADFELAALASIHGISNMISDCNRIFRVSSRQWSTAVANLWQQELLQLLEQFEFLAVEPSKNSTPAIALIFQTVSLSLYLPLGVLESFSGKDGPARSSAIYESFIQHISPAHLRKASWHAGQVLRLAKSMPSGSLISSRAACVYFSALALWSLATVFSLKGLAPENESCGKETFFFLDGMDDNDALRRFTVLGQGVPALSSTGQPVYLEDRAAVMRLLQQLFSPEHGGCISDQQTRALRHTFTILGCNDDPMKWQMEDKNI